MGLVAPCGPVATSVIGASGSKAIRLSKFRPVPDVYFMVYPSRCTPRFWRVLGYNAGSTALVKASAFWSLVPTRLNATSSRSNCSFTEAKITRCTPLRCLTFLEYPAVTTFAHAVLSSRSLSIAQHNSTNGKACSKSTYDNGTVSASVVLQHVAVLDKGNSMCSKGGKNTSFSCKSLDFNANELLRGQPHSQQLARHCDTASLSQHAILLISLVL